MRTAVFDSDETLIYSHSALIWSKHIHIRNILKIPKHVHQILKQRILRGRRSKIEMRLKIRPDLRGSDVR